jgi:hypothetical protein
LRGSGGGDDIASYADELGADGVPESVAQPPTNVRAINEASSVRFIRNLHVQI